MLQVSVLQRRFQPICMRVYRRLHCCKTAQQETTKMQSAFLLQLTVTPCLYISRNMYLTVIYHKDMCLSIVGSEDRIIYVTNDCASKERMAASHNSSGTPQRGSQGRMGASPIPTDE